MYSATNTGSPKKATNLSINKDLLIEARSLQINLSATLEEALLEKVGQKKREKWLQENREGIKACNDLTEKAGLFSDKYRTF